MNITQKCVESIAAAFRQYRTDTVMEKSSTVVPATSSSLELARPSPPIVAKQEIWSLTSDISEIKVGLEATGHYHLNLLRSLLDNGLDSYVINPLHTNLFRKDQSLRKTKTDKVDAASIAMMLLTDRTLKPYSDTSYHNEELKSLTRYRFDKVQERAVLKTSVGQYIECS